ncbi:hypothetical protein L484_012705 [Morus notabilis]|uniref:Uncharacterized protein n=1 Tax=Morus notabilis TaxID=981085 RepID=W9S448_9ROSA|nr:hypothetical protein L484_012705 [Morus notabilis]
MARVKQTEASCQDVEVRRRMQEIRRQLNAINKRDKAQTNRTSESNEETDKPLLRQVYVRKGQESD